MTTPDPDLYCRIHLDHLGPTAAIERLVADLLAASVTREGVVTDQLNVLVDHGDSYPPISERDYSDWINWKYSLEVVPAGDITDNETFAEPVKMLLKKLSERGVRAVPACDFEDLLAPWNWVNA